MERFVKFKEDVSLQTVSENLKDDRIIVLRKSLFHGVAGKVTEQGRRTVLVYDRQDNFIGCFRPNDILELAIPSALKDSPYSSYLTGMFVAQCKIVGNQPVRCFLNNQSSINIEAPLMTAVHLMVSEKLINLPVLQEGRLVGLLRDKDLLLEISNLVVGED